MKIILFSLFFILPRVNSVKQLILVQSFYNNAESLPSHTFPNDNFPAEKWVGELGQLTENGVQQHEKLGRLVREKYTDFLPTSVNNWQLNVTCVDSSSTIESAIAVNRGMYPENSSNIIQIHLQQQTFCQSYFDKIWHLAKTIPKVRSVVVQPDFYSNLSDFVGEQVDDSNLPEIYSTLSIEKLKFGQQFEEETSWCTVDLMNEMRDLTREIRQFSNGIGLDEIYVDDIDIGQTLKQLQAGTLLADIYNRMVLKIECETSDSEECQTIYKLKYWAFSTFSSSIFALFSALRLNFEYPEHVSSLLIELWQESDGDQETFFRLIYYDSENDLGLENVVTKEMSECFDDFCDLSIFRNYSLYYQFPDDNCLNSAYSSRTFLFFSFNFILILSRLL